MVKQLLLGMLLVPVVVSANFIRDITDEVWDTANPNIRYVLNVGGPIACGFAAEAQNLSKKEHIKLFAVTAVYAAAISYFRSSRVTAYERSFKNNFKLVLAKYCVGLASGRFRRIVMSKLVSKPTSKSEAVAAEFADAGGCCCH